LRKSDAEVLAGIFAMAKLIPLGDVAALLRVSVDQVLGFVLDGELRCVNVGRGYKRPRRIGQDDDEQASHP